MYNFFNSFGIISGGILNVSAREAFVLCKQGAIILDVRKEIMNQYKVFDVEKVIYCPYDHINDNISLLPTDVPLIVADSVGLHSKEVVLHLSNNGFQNLANLAGGIVDWERDEQPLKIDKTFELNGACVCRLRPKIK